MAEDTSNPKSAEYVRNDKGKFAPGTKAGPGGSRKLPEEVVELLRLSTPQAVQAHIAALKAVKIIQAGKDQFLEIPDHGIRMQAAENLLNRYVGKPAQAIVDEDGKAIAFGLVILPSEDK